MEERRGLAGLLGVREWLVASLVLQSGLRVSEVSALCFGDLFLGPRCPFLVVRQGKGGKSRRVKISRQLREGLEWLVAWRTSRGLPVSPEGPVVESPRSPGRGLSVRGLQGLFKRVVTSAGVRKRNNFHMARHTYATHLLRASRNNLVLVRDQLGHSSIEVTQVYLHLIPGEDQKALNRMY